MAQTEKSTAAVNAILADNTAQAISPQDMRDVVASMMGGYASMLLTIAGAPAIKSSVAQTLLIITEYDRKEAQSIDVNLSGVTANDSTGKITIGVTGLYKISFYSSFSSSAANKNILFRLFLNSVVSNIGISRFVANTNQNGAVGFDVIVALTASDVIDVRISIDSASSDISFDSLGFNCYRVG